MSSPPTLSLFARLTGRRQRALRAPEPADMGTAFGMEQWLSGASEPLAPAKPPVRRWPNRWLPGNGRR